jgi:O-antigen/teichoic acid export membrane protein
VSLGLGLPGITGARTPRHGDPYVDALKEKTIRGGTARLSGQAGRSLIRLGSIIILARLLDPSEFGLVAMVTVLTGVFEIFSTGGLSQATVQRQEISNEQISTLFWVNVTIGILLAILSLMAAPLLGAFYQEPRTALVMAALAPAFIFAGVGVQHVALLQRHLRFATLSALEVGSEIAGAAVGIGMAFTGWGYWALVGSALAMPLFLTIGAWAATGWRPGPPGHDRGVAAMLRFGGTLTLNNLVVYAAYNSEKILLGRYFGTDALGIYSRAYELINLPTRIFNSAVGGVAFSALSRLQGDPMRFKNYFLKGYSLVLSVTLPTTLFCTALADDIILVVLGPKWTEAALIFRLLAPTIFVFGIINPFAWLLQSTGLHQRSLNIAFVIAPIAIGSYFIGIPFGPAGVALAYSTAMSLWVVPHIFWCLHGTPISVRDLLPTVARPLFSSLAAVIVGLGIQYLVEPIPYALVRLALSGTAMLAVYAWALLFVMKQKAFYVDLLRASRRPA